MDAQPVASSTPLAGGHLLAAISTSIVGILREHYGRGPMKAKTYALDDIIVVVMRGSGFTPLERTIMDSGEPERVCWRSFEERALHDRSGLAPKIHLEGGRTGPAATPSRVDLSRHVDRTLS